VRSPMGLRCVRPTVDKGGMGAPTVVRAVSVFIGAAILAGAAAGTVVGSEPSVVAVGGTSADRARLDEVLEMFEVAGLTIDNAEVHFVEPGAGGCGDGWVGEYRTRWRRSVVTVCTDSQRTLVHELAHVWLDDHLSRRDQRRLVERWGLPAWRGDEVVWQERASEHAAEIVVWGVMPGTVPRVPDMDPDQLSATYRLLTGRAPAAGFGRQTE
jgi:hypothetical protein